MVTASDLHTSTVTSSTVDGADALHCVTITPAMLCCISKKHTFLGSSSSSSSVDVDGFGSSMVVVVVVVDGFGSSMVVVVVVVDGFGASTVDDCASSTVDVD